MNNSNVLKIGFTHTSGNILISDKTTIMQGEINLNQQGVYRLLKTRVTPIPTMLTSLSRWVYNQKNDNFYVRDNTIGADFIGVINKSFTAEAYLDGIYTTQPAFNLSSLTIGTGSVTQVPPKYYLTPNQWNDINVPFVMGNAGQILFSFIAYWDYYTMYNTFITIPATQLTSDSHVEFVLHWEIILEYLGLA